MQNIATTVYMPGDLRAKVDHTAVVQGRSASSVIVDAVRARLAKGGQHGDVVTVAHLARVEARVDKAVRDGMLVKEALLLFVRVWLEHNPALEDELAESAAASAAARFDRFLDYVAASIDSGRSHAIFDPSAPQNGGPST